MKRLYRSKKDRMIAGVCGGLADYFNVDPVLIRGIFAASIFVGGIGIFLYVILAIVTPEEGEEKPLDTSIKAEETTIEPPVVEQATPRQRRVLGGFIALFGFAMVIGNIDFMIGISPFGRNERTIWSLWDFFVPIAIVGVGLYLFFSDRKEK